MKDLFHFLEIEHIFFIGEVFKKTELSIELMGVKLLARLFGLENRIILAYRSTCY